MIRQRLTLGLLIFGLLVGVGTASGQAAVPVRPVTDDEVNAVAHEIYCPVCPNERLDACKTEACVVWRDVIREQLEQGRSRDQIVAYFVELYGQRAVGIPTDPLLRTVSLVMPYVFAAVVLAVALGSLFYYWQQPAAAGGHSVDAPPPPPPDSAEADYRRLIERDLTS